MSITRYFEAVVERPDLILGDHLDLVDSGVFQLEMVDLQHGFGRVALQLVLGQLFDDILVAVLGPRDHRLWISVDVDHPSDRLAGVLLQQCQRRTLQADIRRIRICTSQFVPII